MSAPVYCRTCTPGRPTRLNRYTIEAGGTQCGACERAAREEWMRAVREAAEAEKRETPHEAVVRVLSAARGPLSNRQIADQLERSDTWARKVISELRAEGVVERATMLCGINRYRLASRVDAAA